MKVADGPPGKNDFEIVLFGPDYGESIVLHVGGGVWIVVDSCIDKDGTPAALRYLNSIGIDPAETVALVVATHWHDDHIRGMAQLVAACMNAKFCCAAALCRTEFLATVGTLEAGASARGRSGVREIRDVFSHLAHNESAPARALADRRIFARDTCQVWSLSPADVVFQRFLESIGALLPATAQTRTRARDLSPNKVAGALWIRVDDVAVLLGSDLERRGWKQVLESRERPSGIASVFKVPHHGSANADEPDVWSQLLEAQPIAMLTPWRLGAGHLPKSRDVCRILSRTPRAYVTTRQASAGKAGRRRPPVVNRTLREAGARLQRVATSSGAIRLRRRLGAETDWTVELFGTACRLDDFAA